MANKTVPLSARISRDDADFLADLQVEGADTPSEKLRAIVSEARRRHRGAQDYPGALKFAEETLGPALRSIRTSEVCENMHSELVTRVAEWLPETMAYFLAAPAKGGDDDAVMLRRLEAGLAMRVTTLMQSVLQLGLTSKGALYDPDMINEHLTSVLDLAQVIQSARDARENP